MRLNTLVNGLIAAYITAAPLNAQAQAPTSYAAGTPQYALIAEVAGDAFRSGKATPYKEGTNNPYKEGTNNQGRKEATLYSLTLAAPNETMQVEVYDWDKNRTLSSGDYIAMGSSNGFSDLKNSNPWYKVTRNGFEIHPADQETSGKLFLMGVFKDSEPDAREAMRQRIEASTAERAYNASQAQLGRLEQLRNNRGGN
ncbi:hypothetical protein HYW21_04775 [Candidatus Woesearchaeota archaeon]|nr:hypothetical protein [Candidatus Woesearchaeota archaeon]